MTLHTASALAVLCLASPTPGQMLDPLDRATLDSALVLLNLRPAELGFDKAWAEDDTFRLAVVERLLSDPLAFPDYVDETTTAVDSFICRPWKLISFIDRQLEVLDKGKSPTPSEPPDLSFDRSDPFRLWTETLEQAEPLRKRFYEQLDSLELHDLIMAAPAMWSEADDSINARMKGGWQFEFSLPVDTTREANSDRILDIIKKLDTEALLDAAMIVLPAAQALAGGFAANYTPTPVPGEGYPNPPPGTGMGDLEGATGEILFYTETEWGRFVVGGVGNNVYSGDFAAIVDIGGDDVYRGRCAGAMGELSHPYSLLIDLNGDDYYDAGGLAVGHGAGFLGIGILVDRSGNDTYRSGSYSQGAGLFGVGVLADHGGADDRRGGYFLQGAGHCGVGILIDDGGGDDRYHATAWGQGFGSTFGYGLLYDSGGDDSYRTGGAYLHEPLLPHDYKSFSGGFGMGWRPRAGGGIGVLYDTDGNDFYNGEVFCFGASYWYSIGILVDGGGNDYYSAAHYGLGAGIHLALGALYDRGGDDQYRSRYGVVGGTGHDLSVGILVDAGGDDGYIVSDGWGVSLTNSVGLFIDRLGNDTYATRGSGYSFGSVRWARGFSGAAIFLDLEGDDVYPAGEAASDSSIWIESGWGIGIDLPRDTITGKREEEIGGIELTAEDSARSVEELFKEASRWEVGSAREAVRRARKALIAKGGEAIHWSLDEKLDTRSGLERRTLDELVKALPDTAGPLLIEKLGTSSDRLTLANAVYLLSTIKWQPAVDPLLSLLERKDAVKVRNAVISTLGKIGDQRAASPISRFVTDREERRRLTAITALKDLKDTSTINTVIKGLDDPLFTVRSAAAGGLIAFGISAAPYLTDYVQDEESRYPELGLRALGRITTTLQDSAGAESGKVRYEATRLFEFHITNPNEQVRAAAVDALYRNGGERTRQMLDWQMEIEYNPVVLAAYRRARKAVK